jgi:hypothetical protein
MTARLRSSSEPGSRWPQPGLGGPRRAGHSPGASASVSWPWTSAGKSARPDWSLTWPLSSACKSDCGNDDGPMCIRPPMRGAFGLRLGVGIRRPRVSSCFMPVPPPRAPPPGVPVLALGPAGSESDDATLPVSDSTARTWGQQHIVQPTGTVTVTVSNTTTVTVLTRTGTASN